MIRRATAVAHCPAALARVRALLSAIIVTLACTAFAQAHPLGNFTVNHFSRLEVGARRVAEYHKQHRFASAEDLCQGLLSAVASQSESASLADDQTVLVLRSAPVLDRDALLGDTAR